MVLSEEIQQYIIDNSYTKEQVESLTYQQLCVQFGTHSVTEFKNSMRPILADMQRTINDGYKQGVTTAAKPWIQSNIPDTDDVEFEFKSRSGKRVIITHLDGTPIEEES